MQAILKAISFKGVFYLLIFAFLVTQSQRIIFAQTCPASEVGNCDICPDKQTCTYIDEFNEYGCNTVPGQCGAPAAPSDDGDDEAETPDYVEGDVGSISLSSLRNPATNFGDPTTFIGTLIGGTEDSPGLLTIAIVGGGFLLLIMLISGGFTMLSSPNSPEAQDNGRKRIVWAVIGFFVLFSAFWIMQIIELIFGINVTGTDAGTPGGSGGSDPNAGEVCIEGVCSDGLACRCQNGDSVCHAASGQGSCCDGVFHYGSICPNDARPGEPPSSFTNCSPTGGLSCGSCRPGGCYTAPSVPNSYVCCDTNAGG